MSTTFKPLFSTSNHATLGLRLIEALQKEPRAAQIIQRGFICNRTIPEHLPATLLARMQDYPHLALLLEELRASECATGLIKSVTVALGPLLAWASTQSWADAVAWNHLLASWPNAFSRKGPLHTVQSIDYALAVFEPTIAMLAPERRATMLAAWLSHSNLWEISHWSPKEVYGHHARIWCSLGLLAEMAPQTQTSAPMDDWHAKVKTSLYGLDTWHQETMILAILDSTLNDTTKLQAACAGDTEVLLNVAISEKLLQLLPNKEDDRINLLAWSTAAGAAQKSASLRTYMVAEAAQINSQMVREYCPHLHAMLQCMVHPRDWAVQSTIARLMHVVTTSKEALELPLDWETA